MADGRRSSVAVSWSRIERWFATHLPAESLPGGATAATIRRVEKMIGVQFPDTLRQLYEIHDGSNGIAICKAGYLMPLVPRKRSYKGKPLIVPTVSETWSSCRELLEAGMWKGMRSKPRGPIKRDWWNMNWIPIIDNEQGDNLCVDMEPPTGGKKGQVIDWWHEQGAYKLLADSVAKWLSTIAADLREGRFEPEL